MEWLMRHYRMILLPVLFLPVVPLFFLRGPVDGFTRTTNIHPRCYYDGTVSKKATIRSVAERWRFPRNGRVRPPPPPQHQVIIDRHHHSLSSPPHVRLWQSNDPSTPMNSPEAVVERTEFTTTTTTTTTTSTTRINGNTTQSTAVAATMRTNAQWTATDQPSPPPPRIQLVVVMNANARGVSPLTIRMAQEVFGKESVHVTHTIPELRRALQPHCSVLSPPPPPPPFVVSHQQQQQRQQPRHVMIVTMGGDGTLATTIQTMCQILFQQQQQQAVGDAENSSSFLSSEQPPQQLTYTSMMSQLPMIAYVPLGTGNAVGSVVGCSSGPSHPHPRSPKAPLPSTATAVSPERPWFRRRWMPWMIRTRRPGGASAPPTASSRSVRQLESTLRHIHETIRRYNNRTETASATTSPTIPLIELPMIEISNANFTDVCFFAGAGFDSVMLNDFKEIKEWSHRTGWWTNVLSSVVGYCVTLLVKTLPKTVLRSSHMVHVQVSTNQINNTYWVDHRRGDFVQPCTLPILYQGTTGIIAGSTVPYYGGKLRLFPFARISPDKLHLRIGRIHPLIGFINLPKIFAGSYRDFSPTRFGVLDFIGNDFTITVSSGSKDATSNGFPLQHSGESIGSVSSFRLRVIDAPIRFLNLLPDR